MEGYFLGKGKVIKKDGWLVSEYHRRGDEYPTLKIRKAKKRTLTPKAGC